MALPQREARFDAAAYLAWEETQTGRHEYLAGEVLAMVGVRQSHNVATGNLYTALRRELRGSPCRVFIEAIKLRVEAADCFFYPDVTVTCDPRDRLTPDYVSHPVLVAEVLSESTAAFDRGGKFAAYRKLDSLREYVLVDLAAQRIEVFRRDPENHWVLYDYSPDDEIELPSLGVRLGVAELLADTLEDAGSAEIAGER
ncbi:Uma2 family endonuclease [Accumulibacter sp.]|uniref:Uma2 family endonuclease n=1 Tax=Accumulibacter sp. TaxID=2053492 RepID=UPI0025EF875B|nr:Uma2 family endonuclease [Accumulibacter sp.]MCM8595397.1 Uma2 family endonuclease [Accumulibacter sp.]MCM8626422.1 Uma2 family endonuclease [Accumulibacter sp.]MDS4049544.1 Uma2 family endonuclease [Accumulibacter sp.]